MHRVSSSSVQVLFEEASSRSIEEWAKLCDLKAADIIEVAKEYPNLCFTK